MLHLLFPRLLLLPLLHVLLRLQMHITGAAAANYMHHTAELATVQVDISAGVIASTRDEYVSYNIDSTENRNYFERNLSSPQLAAFARELSPAFMRIGGSGANILFYHFGDDAGKQHPARYVWHWKQWTVANTSAKYLEPALWESVCKLSVAAGAKLVLNVNMIQFAEDGGHNMKQLLQWTIGKGYRIHHVEPSNELGTPPVSVLQGMHNLLVELYPDEQARPGLIGSDDGECPPCADLMRAQCKNASVPLFAANYHKYSDCDKVLSPQDVANISAFSYADGAETWIGEAASCGSGGHPGVSDTFASGFWYMQHLGRLAQLNHRVFLRQSLIGGNYGLLRDRFWDKNMTGDAVLPNTDYFVAVLFKRQMGNDVFATQPSKDGKVLAYAHCARKHPGGGLAVALINFDTSVRSTSVQAVGGGSLDGARVEYILTAAGGERGGPYSQFAQLNGRGTPLASAKDLADGAKAGKGATVTLPPQSFGVVVWPGAGVALCGGS